MGRARPRQPSSRVDGAGTEGASPRSWRAIAMKRQRRALTSSEVASSSSFNHEDCTASCIGKHFWNVRRLNRLHHVFEGRHMHKEDRDTMRGCGM